MLRSLSVALALLVVAGPGRTQTGPLDLIPADGMFGIGIRSLEDLKKKGDDFIKDSGIDVPIRPSQIFDEVYKMLGVKGGIDEKGPAAAFLVNEKVVGAKLGLVNLDKYLVVALPVSDLDKFAANFGIKAGELKEGKTVAGNSEMIPVALHLRPVGKVVFLSPNKDAITSVVEGKKVGDELSEARRKTVASGDLIFHLGTEAWGGLWKDFLRDAEEGVKGIKEEADREAAQQFVKALPGMRFGVGSVRLDGGLTVNLMAIVSEKHQDATKFLGTLRAGDGPSDLKGLPTGTVIVTQAARGDGSKNATLARVAVESLLPDVLEANKFVVPSDRAMFASVFTEVWVRLRGSRFALYKTADESKLGLFSLVGILDTEDAKKFVAELRQLAKLGDAEGIDLTSDKGKEENLAEIDKLIKDLGDRSYRVRESAENKLRLIGDPVLPVLEKAAKSNDAEVAKRAERLRLELVSTAEQRRKEILGKQTPLAIKPSFAFQSKGETIDGQPVDLVGVKLSKKDADSATRLRQLLGPDWNKIRVAPMGKQVVVMVGSDVKLFEQAIKNVKDGKAGLAEAATLTEFRKRSDALRKIEFHVSSAAVKALVEAKDLEKPGTIKPSPDLTSFALTVELDRVQLDVFVPMAEIKALVKRGEQ